MAEQEGTAGAGFPGFAMVNATPALPLKLEKMIKALFFDVDGTLVSFKTHRIPQSAVDALTEAKRRGVGIYISTGRPKRLINNLDEISGLVDGYITATGAYCTVGADEMNFATLVVGVGGLTVINPNDDVDRLYRKMLNVSDLGEGVPVEDVLEQGIIQFTPIIDVETERRLMPMMAHCVSARWYPDFADITVRGADKGTALQAMAGYLRLDMSETMAFGDGGNDIPIIRAAGVGVAMGNAADDVKAAADYVTSGVDDDGVASALRHFGII